MDQGGLFQLKDRHIPVTAIPASTIGILSVDGSHNRKIKKQSHATEVPAAKPVADSRRTVTFTSDS